MLLLYVDWCVYFAVCILGLWVLYKCCIIIIIIIIVIARTNEFQLFINYGLRWYQ